MMIMKVATTLFMVGNVCITEAFVVANSRPTHGGVALSPAFTPTTTVRLSYKKSEAPEFNFDSLLELERLLLKEGSDGSLKAAEAKHGMPWQTSIDKKAFTGEPLLYMPFWDWQIKFLQENLTDLKVLPCTNEDGMDFSYNENKDKKARIVNLCLSSQEYRKIRLTYYDAGDNTQVYNAVLYPDPKYNLPILGIDLLAFNRKKYLTIVDFQPLSDTIKFGHLLEPVRSQYPSLQGEMTDRFYSAQDSYFSDCMLLGRHDAGRDISATQSADSMVYQDLFPAYQHYLQTHVELVKNHSDSSPAANNGEIDNHLAPHRNYDQYSAERDPAHALLARAFGPDWAMDYVYDVLFPLAERPASERNA